VALAAVLFVSPLGGRQPAAQRTVTPTPDISLLINGDFEGAFARQWNAANDEWVNGRVAQGWSAWWREPTDRDGAYPRACAPDADACVPWHVPEYRETKGIPYTPPRARSGLNSQMYFTSFGVHEGGLYQKASGTPDGWRVRFSIWLRAWSRDDSTNTFESKDQPGMRLRVGIDPAGGVDPWADSVVWGDEFEAFDEFVEASVVATAQADAVTVFVRSAPERPLRHIDVMLDDAELVLLGPPPPTPVVISPPEDVAGVPVATAASGKIVVHIVQPGDTLFAIAQQYRADLAAIYALNGLNETSVLKIGQAIRVPLPGETAPTATPPPPTPQPIVVGSVCVSAFEDAAGDGRYDAGDGPLAGAAFIIADASGATVAAANRPRCFDDLPAGAYAVSAQVPAGFVATTDTQWGVAVAEGARVEVVVGGQRQAESDVETGPDTTPIAVGTGAIVFMAAAIVWLRRRAKST
jgi:hypothetical protein